MLPVISCETGLQFSERAHTKHAEGPMLNPSQVDNTKQDGSMSYVHWREWSSMCFQCRNAFHRGGEMSMLPLCIKYWKCGQQISINPFWILQYATTPLMKGFRRKCKAI